MFFMITYAMVNIVVLVEQLLSLPSYRPTLKVPLIIPALGAFGSIAIMFVINVIVALTSLILIFIFYFYFIGYEKVTLHKLINKKEIYPRTTTFRSPNAFFGSK